jgi:hypothetical protein
MDRDERRKIERKEQIYTYLSTTPSTAPTLPGPYSIPHCPSASAPYTHGMRSSSSTSFARKPHIFIASTGVIVVADFDFDFPIPLRGNDDDVATATTSARTTEKAKNAN